MRYILISGKAGVGKTELAKALHRLNPRIALASFAKQLKYIAFNHLLWDGNKDERGRRLLQNLGRIAREYDEDIWARILLSETAGNQLTAVDDWRFKNEAIFLFRTAYVFKVRVTGRASILNGSLAEDQSETELPSPNVDRHYYHYVVNNNHDLEYLEEEAALLLEKFNEKTVHLFP